ncbi:hypothetical protein ACFQ9X_56985 [Catenulispora yoronensis]
MLVLLASHAEKEKDAEGNIVGDFGTWDSICPSIDYMATWTRLSRSAVDRALRELRDDWLLLAYDGLAPERNRPKETLPPKRYRLTGTPQHPLPEAVERQRALARGEIWFGEPLQPDTEPASGPVDKPVDNSASLISETRIDVASDLRTDVEPKISTGFPHSPQVRSLRFSRKMEQSLAPTP